MRRRAPAWVVVVGVVAAWAWSPAPARADGFWVSLAAGSAGASNPSDYSEFWFDSPHAPPIAVNPFTGDGLVQVSTAGGSTFFTGEANPILIPTQDGFATITNPGVANGSGGLPRFAGGAQASGAPQTGADIGGANLVSGSLGDRRDDGSRVLSVGVKDKDGNSLGSGNIDVPNGGWWVVGIGPGEKDTTGGGGDPGPIGGGTGGGTGGGDPGTGGGDPGPVGGGGGGGSGGGNGNGGGSVTTPEPGTVVLLGLGGLTAAGCRRLRSK